VYKGIRKITRTRAPRVNIVKGRNGLILKGSEEVKSHCKKYFEELYDDPITVDRTALSEISKTREEEKTRHHAGWSDEVRAARVKMMKNKSPWIDNIMAEEVQATAERNSKLTIAQLLRQVWRKEEIPGDWKKAVIIPIHKKKDRLNCGNYRGISLFCHCSKLFTSILLLQRLKSRPDEVLAEDQAGFRAGRSTVDQIFTLRQLAEMYVKYSKKLYVCYIDFRKAFNSIWREGLWNVMRDIWYPEKIVRILERFMNYTTKMAHFRLR
jgi:Reverse transcriptase (RNA-dependent DNA polymerase)